MGMEVGRIWKADLGKRKENYLCFRNFPGSASMAHTLEDERLPDGYIKQFNSCLSLKTKGDSVKAFFYIKTMTNKQHLQGQINIIAIAGYLLCNW